MIEVNEDGEMEMKVGKWRKARGKMGIFFF